MGEEGIERVEVINEVRVETTENVHVSPGHHLSTSREQANTDGKLLR